MIRTLALAATGILLILIFVFSCGRDPASAGDRTGSLMLALVFATEERGLGGSHTPDALVPDSLSVTVSGSGMDTLRVVVPVVDNEASGTIEGIPVGRNRWVDAVAWSAEPRVNLYGGDTTLAIEAGTTTEATLVMSRLQVGPLAHVEVFPDTTRVGRDVVADASASLDPYEPDSVLVFRFMLGGDEIRGWSTACRDTFPAPVKGRWCVGAEARNGAGVVGAASCTLHVLNTPPGSPGSPRPEPGETVRSLAPCLQWSSSDPDADVLSFTVWYGSDSASVTEERSSASSVVSVTDSVTITGLQAEMRYFWKVVASDGEDVSRGELWDFVTASAAFTAQPDTLRFPCEANQLTITLAAIGDEALQWTAVSQDTWLDVSPSSGVLEGVDQTVWITVVSRAGFSPGSQWGAVHFQGEGFVAPVTVEMEVAPELGGALPDSLFLEVPAFEDTLLFANTGCGDLAWETQGDAAWMLALPASGIVPEGGIGSVRVRGDTTGMSIGDHAATLVLNASTTSSLIYVTLRVPQGLCLDVIPDSVHIGIAASSVQCVVANCGTAQLTWSASPEEPWITVVPSEGGLAPFEANPVAVSADLAGLPSGFAQTGVSFFGADAPVYLIVTVMVPGVPVLGLSPAEVYLHADTDGAVLTVENAGTGVLAWAVTGLPTWSSLVPESGILPQGEYAYPVLSVERYGLDLGSHEGVLTIESNGGSHGTSVTMDVGAAGCADPVCAADFNDGTAQGWVVDPAVTWRVEDGRYVAGAIPQGVTGWSQHAIDYTGSTRCQADVFFGAEPAGDAEGATAFVCQDGFTINVQGSSCDAIASVVRSDGTVELQGRAAATGLWFPCSSAGGGVFFAQGWNSLAVTLHATHLGGTLNGQEVTQYQFPVQLRLPPLGAVGLAARGEGDVGFDRVFVCGE
ncbi:BACON domain-containing protein [Candidatus Fermentibacteria bacterium]|nr:BACON domain-containing protein [Candidatus Fermentibacteria bacterium]